MYLNVYLNLPLLNHQSLSKKKNPNLNNLFFLQRHLNYKCLQTLYSERKKNILSWALSTLQWPVITPIKPTGSIEMSAVPLQSSSAGKCRKKKARCDSINQLHAELSLLAQHKQSLSSPLLSFQAGAHYTEQWARADGVMTSLSSVFTRVRGDGGAVFDKISSSLQLFPSSGTAARGKLCIAGRRRTSGLWWHRTCHNTQLKAPHLIPIFLHFTAVCCFIRRQQLLLLLQQEEIRAQDRPCCSCLPVRLQTAAAGWSHRGGCSFWITQALSVESDWPAASWLKPAVSWPDLQPRCQQI